MLLGTRRKNCLDTILLASQLLSSLGSYLIPPEVPMTPLMKEHNGIFNFQAFDIMTLTGPFSGSRRVIPFYPNHPIPSEHR